MSTWVQSLLLLLVMVTASLKACPQQKHYWGQRPPQWEPRAGSCPRDRLREA